MLGMDQSVSSSQELVIDAEVRMCSGGNTARVTRNSELLFAYVDGSIGVPGFAAVNNGSTAASVPPGQCRSVDYSFTGPPAPGKTGIEALPSTHLILRWYLPVQRSG